MGEIRWLILFVSLALITLTGCQSKPTFTPLPKSPSNLTITKYDGTYKNVKAVSLTGEEEKQIRSELNAAGTHIIPRDAVFHCGAASKETTVYRDIIVHYKQSPDRLFEMNSEGCTFLDDIKDDIRLNPKSMPELDKYFK